MATVRELITKIGFNLDATPLLKAEASISSFKNVALGATAVIAGAATSMFLLAKSSAHAAEELDNNATKLGVSTEEFQKMSFAAAQAGVSQETLIGSLGILSVHLEKAREGSKEAVSLFGKVGIKPDQIKNFKSASDLFKTLADRLNEIQDPLKKGALTKELLGRGGLMDLPLIKEGSKGINEAGEQLKRLGGILDDNTIKAGHKFNDQLEVLATIFDALKNKVGAGLFAPLSHLIDKFLEWMESTKNQAKLQKVLTDILKILEVTMKGVWFVVSNLWQAFDLLGDAVGGVDNLLEGLFALFVLWQAANFPLTITALGYAFSILLGPIGLIVTTLAAAIAIGNEFYDTMIGRQTTLAKWLNDFSPTALKTFREFTHGVSKMVDDVIDAIVLPFKKIYQMIDGLNEKVFGLIRKLGSLIGVNVPDFYGSDAEKKSSKPFSSLFSPSQSALNSPLAGSLGAKKVVGQQTNNLKYDQHLTFNIAGNGDPDTIKRVTEEAQKEFHDRTMRSTLRAVQAGTN
jgi:hypothetical protein